MLFCFKLYNIHRKKISLIFFTDGSLKEKLSSRLSTSLSIGGFGLSETKSQF